MDGTYLGIPLVDISKTSILNSLFLKVVGNNSKGVTNDLGCFDESRPPLTHSRV